MIFIYINIKKIVMTVKINNDEITLKKSIRAIVVFEMIAQKAFEIKGLSDMLVYFYATTVTSKEKVNIGFMEFCDWVDAHEGIMDEFSKWVLETSKVDEAIGKNKKKVTPKKTDKSSASAT